MSRKRPQLRGEQIVALLERLGYQRVGRKGGSHRKLRKVIAGIEHNITVPVHKGKTLHPELRDALLKEIAERNRLTLEDLLDLV
ncbi:MAG: type II toxin-antitoxin system HicA family toxin [Candidatus Caldarchaeum sp.]